MSNQKKDGDEKRWLDNPKNVSKLVYLLVAACILSVLADFVWSRHGHFSFEEIPAFYAVYGFVAYCFIVLSAKQLRRILKRDENYYD